MFKTKQKLIFSALAAYLTATALCAGEVTIPNTFSANTKAKASEVNANFAAVKTAVDDNAYMTGIAIETLATSGEISRSALYDNIYTIRVNVPADGYIHVLATGEVHIQKFNTGEGHLVVGIRDNEGKNIDSAHFSLNSDYGGYYTTNYTLQGVVAVTKGVHEYIVTALDVGDNVLFNKTIDSNKVTAIFYKHDIKN